jgi:hypothetical protein
MQSRPLVLLVLAGPVVAFVGWATGPRLAALWLGSKYLVNSAQSFEATLLEKDYTVKGVDSFVPIGGLTSGFPKSMRTHTTEIVSVALKPIAELEKPPIAHLESARFKIVGKPTPVRGNDQYQWSWQISPDESGDWIVSLWFEPDIELTMPTNSGLVLDNTKTKVDARVTVLTDLGLTITQEAIAKALAALLGLVGTVAGYSFLRARAEHKPPTYVSGQLIGSRAGRGKSKKTKQH